MNATFDQKAYSRAYYLKNKVRINEYNRSRTKAKTCPSCGHEWRPTLQNRRYCSEACRDRKWPCKTLGCDGRVTRVKDGWCERCHGAMRRHGDLVSRKRRAADRRTNEAGYVILFRPEHPLASEGGYVFEHRAVAHAHHGPGLHPCRWCGTILGWDALRVDHLNEEKADNRPDNLVLACNACNMARGAIVPFVLGLSDDSFALLVRTFAALREAEERSA